MEQSLAGGRIRPPLSGKSTNRGMIRFRIGQRWKSERTGSPTDAFGLELDGVDVLSGAGEESLLRVVPELCEALAALWTGERLAQVSLPDAHLELLLERADSDVNLEVLSLARPARRVRGPVRVELNELREAAIKTARALMADLREHAPAVASQPELRSMMKALHALETRGIAAASQSGGAFEDDHGPHGAVSFGFGIDDKNGRVHDFSVKLRNALPSLGFGGELRLYLGEEPVWTGKGQPFLLALELSRQAAELLHAIEISDSHFSFKPGGVGEELTVKIDEGKLRTRGGARDADALSVAAAMFEVGQALSAALIRAHKAQAKNAYLQELIARCREGLVQVRSHRPAAKPAAPAKEKRKREKKSVAEEAPLSSKGRLRRVRYEQQWSTEPLGAEAGLKLLLGKKGPVVSGEELACGYTPQGRLRFQHAASRGVAVDADGFTLTATANRISGFHPDEKSARWIRDHDGLPIGPELFREDGLWITRSRGRSVLGFNAVTGRELWRISPSRTQKVHLAIASSRALLTTDAGHLFGLALEDGAVLYRMKASQPFEAAVVPFGKRLLTRVSAGDRIAVTCAELQTGAIHWTKELTLSRPSQPLPGRDRVYLAGERSGDATLLCLTKKGDLAWERRLHLGPGPYTLTAVKRAVVVTSRAGAAAFVDSDGRMVWRVGAPTGEELACAVPSVVGRGIVVVPGPMVRAVDARTGQLLAEVKANPSLCDLQIDRALGLYLLDEDGTLTAYKLSTHLAVMD